FLCDNILLFSISHHTHVSTLSLHDALPIFSTNWTVTVLATIGLMIFHVFIYSMFALAMPQEWNLFYVFYTQKRFHSCGIASANIDRKSTRLNSSHVKISYAVFCLKKKKKYT